MVSYSFTVLLTLHNIPNFFYGRPRNWSKLNTSLRITQLQRARLFVDGGLAARDGTELQRGFDGWGYAGKEIIFTYRSMLSTGVASGWIRRLTSEAKSSFGPLSIIILPVENWVNTFAPSIGKNNRRDASFWFCHPNFTTMQFGKRALIQRVAECDE